jgi:hypothetical protein
MTLSRVVEMPHVHRTAQRRGSEAADRNGLRRCGSALVPAA